MKGKETRKKKGSGKIEKVMHEKENSGIMSPKRGEKNAMGSSSSGTKR